jgi:hypothetical protein
MRQRLTFPCLQVWYFPWGKPDDYRCFSRYGDIDRRSSDEYRTPSETKKVHGYHGHAL